MLVKPLPCCTMLSIFPGSTLQELSHLCTTLHIAMYICSFCLLYIRVTRQSAGQHGSHFVLVATYFRPWLLLKCFLFSPWTGQEQWRLLPSGISCCWAVTFPPAEGICYRPELKQSGGGGFEFMSSRVRFPLKRLEKDQSLPLPSCLAVSYTNQFYSPIFWKWGYGQLFWRREQCCGSRVSKLLRLLKGRSKASCLQYFPVGQL